MRRMLLASVTCASLLAGGAYSRDLETHEKYIVGGVGALWGFLICGSVIGVFMCGYWATANLYLILKPIVAPSLYLIDFLRDFTK